MSSVIAPRHRCASIAVTFEVRVFCSQPCIWRAPRLPLRSACTGAPLDLLRTGAGLAVGVAAFVFRLSHHCSILVSLPARRKPSDPFRRALSLGAGALGVADQAAHFVPRRSLNPSGGTSRQHIISPLCFSRFDKQRAVERDAPRRLSALWGLWPPNRESGRRYRPPRPPSESWTSCRRPSAPAARPWWASPGKEAVGLSACLVPAPSRSGSIDDPSVAACLARGGGLPLRGRAELAEGQVACRDSRALIDRRSGSPREADQ